MHVALGPHRFDIGYRALVMGILNRTPDSFFDQGDYWDFDAFLAKAEGLVDEGADFLDVGGVKAGPGPDVDEQEELDRVLPAIEAIVARFDLPVSVDTWRASVARAAYAAGAVVGNDISGFADPDYLPAAAEAGASVVATHIRLAPRVPDPDPTYDDVVAEVCAFLDDRATRATRSGIPAERVMVDAGLDLGKSEPQSLELLRASDRLVDLGYPVFLSASNKRFLGALVGTEVTDRREASLAAHALGIALGCRILRAHDVKGSRRVADVMAEILGGQGRGLMATEPELQLIRGDDPVLIGDEVRRAVAALVGDGDRTLLVDEHAGDEYELSVAVDAAQTLPFLTDRRVVVVRNLARFKVAELTPLLGYLADPAPTTSLVLAWERAMADKGGERFPAVPKKLVDAVTAAGGVVTNTTLGRPADRKAFVDEQLSAAAITLDGAARKALVEQLADDVDRLPSLLTTLEATFGPGTRLTVDDVTPYLGAAGSVAPWELTDAIDGGKIPEALDALHRILGAGERHPLVIMSSLHTHYGRMARLDGASARDEKAAAALLGMKGSTYPAKKALAQGRRLGAEKLRNAIHLLAQADLDLRGAKAWPPELVMEVLVARLARLSRR